MDPSTPHNGNGNGNGNGTHAALPYDPIVVVAAPLSELTFFVEALSREWLPPNARDFFHRLTVASDVPHPPPLTP